VGLGGVPYADRHTGAWSLCWPRSTSGSRVSCIVAARPGGRYAARVSQPEIQRQVRQQRGDIDALYELVQGVDQKVDALDVKLDRRFDELGGQLAEVLRQLGAN